MRCVVLSQPTGVTQHDAEAATSWVPTQPTSLGYQRLGTRIKETLKGHMRAAIRRGILESDGDYVRAWTVTMNNYTRDALRETLTSVMRKGTTYDREDVIHAVAHHLGFQRVREETRQPIKSAINSAIRQGILAYKGSDIWRKQ